MMFPCRRNGGTEHGGGKKLTSETNRDAADREREREPDKQSGVSLHIRVSEVWMP